MDCSIVHITPAWWNGGRFGVLVAVCAQSPCLGSPGFSLLTDTIPVPRRSCLLAGCSLSNLCRQVTANLLVRASGGKSSCAA